MVRFEYMVTVKFLQIILMSGHITSWDADQTIPENYYNRKVFHSSVEYCLMNGFLVEINWNYCIQ